MFWLNCHYFYIQNPQCTVYLFNPTSHSQLPLSLSFATRGNYPWCHDNRMHVIASLNQPDWILQTTVCCPGRPVLLKGVEIKLDDPMMAFKNIPKKINHPHFIINVSNCFRQGLINQFFCTHKIGTIVQCLYMEGSSQCSNNGCQCTAFVELLCKFINIHLCIIRASICPAPSLFLEGAFKSI